MNSPAIFEAYINGVDLFTVIYITFRHLRIPRSCVFLVTYFIEPFTQ